MPIVRRFSFILKLAAAALLTGAADVLFFRKEPGSTLGCFALLWIPALAIAVPAIRRQRATRMALALAAAPALAMVDQPSPLSWMLFWTAALSAAVLSRQKFHDAAEHVLRLMLQAVIGFLTPLRDALRLLRLPRPRLHHSLFKAGATLAVPLLGAAIFIGLFASANPLVARLLPELRFPDIDILLLFFSAAVFATVWPAFRPSRLSIDCRFGIGKPIKLPGVSALSILISLFLFNLIFAVENGLDIAFLWSGAPLPAGMTMADYAHRGAYPLIATALLAGGFVLLTAHPETPTGRHPLIRRLVVLWTAQNLILVASSIIRTWDYIDAYMLTGLRLAALVWMGLVGVSLVLICLRMMLRRSLAWLINRVAAVTAIVLFCSSVADFDALAAEWNVAHAREMGGTGAGLDLLYLTRLGPAALVPLARVETSGRIEAAFRSRLEDLYEAAAMQTIAQQEVPYGWTWRNARRLEKAKAIMAAGSHRLRHTPCGRDPYGVVKICPGTVLTLPAKP